MNQKSILGFSLIELLIAMTISISLISASSFYFRDFSRDEEMRKTINTLVQNIKFIKSEVVFKDKSIILKSTGDKNWSEYQIIENGNVIQTFNAPSGYTFRSNVDGVSFREDNFLIHDSGSPTGYNFTFTICDNKRDDEVGKKLEIGVLGEITYDDYNC